MLQLLLQKLILTTAAISPPLLFSRLYEQEWYAEILRDWISALELQPDANILELGCGPGHLSADLAKKHSSVTGADKSVRMIKHASKLTSNALFVQANALDLPMDNNTFDSVLLASLINVVPDRSLLLKEIFRLLKPGGMISVLFPVTGFDLTQAKKIATQRKFNPVSTAAISVWAKRAKKLSTEEVRTEFLCSGFEKVSVNLHLENNIASVTGFKNE